jgi:hypothetical protein
MICPNYIVVPQELKSIVPMVQRSPGNPPKDVERWRYGERMPIAFVKSAVTQVMDVFTDLAVSSQRRARRA